MALTIYHAFLIIVLWIVAVLFLNHLKLLERHNISLFGPALMWRTERGKEMIDRLARRKRLWWGFGTLSIVVCCIFMFSVLGLLVWEATFVTEIPEESAPTPQMMIGIPGINPFIPIGYGILGLVVALVFHELMHGILTRVSDIPVKSLGLLLFIFPIGAFTEPDEEQLEATTRAKRSRVYAVGPTTNIILAVFCACLFSLVMMPSVEMASPGCGITGVSSGDPADLAGIGAGMMVTGVNGVQINDTGDLVRFLNHTGAGETLHITLYQKGQASLNATLVTEYNYNYEHETFRKLSWYQNETGFLGAVVCEHNGSGAMVTSVFEHSPADDAGISMGDVITNIDGTVVTSAAMFHSTMNQTGGGDRVSITYVDPGSGESVETEAVLSIDRGRLGIYFTTLDLAAYQEFLNRPMRGIKGPLDVVDRALLYISLPVVQLSPVREPITDFYVIDGPWGFMPEGSFWLLANSVYWIFWINILLGMSNALPMLPFDGGFILRDGLDLALEKGGSRRDGEKRKKLATGLTVAMSLFVLGLILWQLIGPRVM